MVDHHVPPLRPDDFVVVCKGPFEGLTGHVICVVERKGGCLVRHDVPDPLGTSNVGGWAFHELERVDG